MSHRSEKTIAVLFPMPFLGPRVVILRRHMFLLTECSLGTTIAEESPNVME